MYHIRTHRNGTVFGSVPEFGITIGELLQREARSRTAAWADGLGAYEGMLTVRL